MNAGLAQLASVVPEAAQIVPAAQAAAAAANHLIAVRDGDPAAHRELLNLILRCRSGDPEACRALQTYRATAKLLPALEREQARLEPQAAVRGDAFVGAITATAVLNTAQSLATAVPALAPLAQTVSNVQTAAATLNQAYQQATKPLTAAPVTAAPVARPALPVATAPKPGGTVTATAGPAVARPATLTSKVTVVRRVVTPDRTIEAFK